MSRFVHSTWNDRTGNFFPRSRSLSVRLRANKCGTNETRSHSGLLTSDTGSRLHANWLRVGCAESIYNTIQARQHCEMQLEMVWNLNVIVCTGTCQSNERTLSTRAHTTARTRLSVAKCPPKSQWRPDRWSCIGFNRQSWKNRRNTHLCVRNSSAQFPLHICLASRNWKINNTEMVN